MPNFESEIEVEDVRDGGCGRLVTLTTTAQETSPRMVASLLNGEISPAEASAWWARLRTQTACGAIELSLIWHEDIDVQHSETGDAEEDLEANLKTIARTWEKHPRPGFA